MQRPGAHSPEAGKPPDALGWRDEDPRDVFRLQLDQASLRVVLQHVRWIALVNAEADRRALEHQEAGDEQYGVPG